MTVETFRYLPDPRRRRPPLVDVHRPSGPGPHPAVLVVHGGGFVVGSRTMRAVRTVTRAATDAGYLAISFDYRLFGRGGRLDEAIADTIAATRWWRARARQLGGDPEDLSVVGISAGAAVATSAARALGPLRRLAGIYGPYDFTNLPGRSPRLAARMLLRTADEATWRDRSPARSCDLDVPLALLHGLQDGLVDVAHTLSFAAWRREQGLPVEVHLYDGIGHAFMRHPELPVTRQAVADLLAFLA